MTLMQFNIKAAWMIDGKIYAGSSHENILHDLDEVTCECESVVHGYIDCSGSFCESIEELLDMQEVMLIRHAQTVFNIRQTNDLDSDLTELGETQVSKVAQQLTKTDLSKYIGYVSPALRTLKTAKGISDATGLKFIVNPLAYEFCAPWRNMDGHKCEFRINVPCRIKEFPEFDWSLYPKDAIFNPETLFMFRNRMKALNASLSKKTVVVTHGAVVFTMIERLIGVECMAGHLPPDNSEPVTNASVSLIHGNKPVYLFNADWREQ